MTRGLKNNNPGNIRKSKTPYIGKVEPSQDKAFEQFETMAYGYRAMFMLLYTYQKKRRLNTIREMIAVYAPPANNNHTDIYVDTVAKRSGVGADSRVTTTNRDVMIPIVAAMSFVENGVVAVTADVNEGWNLFIKDVRP